MSIDWITVAAQIANFLVLVWLLKRFLYRPILDGIDAREAEITARMREAETVKEAAKAREEAYEEKLRALNVAQADMMETVRRKAEEQRDTLLADARAAMAQEQAGWQAQLAAEADKYAARLQGIGADALLSLTRKALTDLADDTFEERVARHLIARIEPVTADLRTAAGQATEAVISSRAPLGSDVRETLRSAIVAAFPGVTVEFETDADQSPGLVMRMGGAQLAWTVESDVDGLDASITARLAGGGDLESASHGQ